MDSKKESENAVSNFQFRRSSFCVPLSQAMKSQTSSMRRSTPAVDDNDALLYSQNDLRVPAAPSKLNRGQNQLSPLLNSKQQISLYSEAHGAATSSTPYTEDILTNNRNKHVITSDIDNSFTSSFKEHSALTKASFDMQLSQVIESQMFKPFRRPSSVQHPLSIEASNQVIEVPPPPAKSTQGSFLGVSQSPYARQQWMEKESLLNIGISSGVQNVQLLYREDEPFNTTDCPCVGGVQLRSIKEIHILISTFLPRIYQDMFNFPYFNILQSLVFDEVLYTDKSVVASAPTGSGKTVIFELALIRLLTKLDSTENHGKIVYMAPMRALCTERYQDWTTKFSCHGLSCLEITGDSELIDFGELLKADLICTTPEKWDSMSRKWKDNKSFFHQIQLFLIDEIHILNDPNRGATVEAVVSRMKTLQTANPNASGNHIRFVAVSATMPNYKDIAEWLGTNCKPAAAFNLGEKFRPVKLERIVLGYPFKEGTSDFRFDMNLSYRLRALIDTYSHSRPTLVFCSSRKSVVQTAEALAKSLRVRSFLINFRTEILQRASNAVHEHKLSEHLYLGIGIHHAGMDTKDRHTVEELFKTSQLPVLISTSTLAMGVNLPAHLVIIKSTHFYNMGLVQEYSDMQILQMIGRAGRPQFDTSATAVIMTKLGLKSKYESLVNGTQMIESSLHKNLIEHLNAEIVLQTISEMTLVVEWIRHTFLYVRVMKNPKYYGLDSNLSTSEVEKRLKDLCQKSLNQLSSLNLVSVDEESSSIFPTSTGRLMAWYCIAYETMKQFHNIGDDQDSISDMLIVMSQCSEFEDIQLRASEKKVLNLLNKDKVRETIRVLLPSNLHSNLQHRYSMTGKIKTRQMKVNCLIQAQLGCLPVQDFSLSQDMAKIFRVGQRIAKCLMEFMYHRSGYTVLLHSILMYKAFKCKLWFDSRYVARQLDGIGPTMSLALANSGLTSFLKLDQASPREIELIVNRHPPFGNQIKETVSFLPRYELTVEQMKCYKPNKAILTLSVDLLNRCILEQRSSNHNNYQSLVIVGDVDNHLILKWRVMDAAILREGGLSQTLNVIRSTSGTKLSISLLSQDWVGLDIHMDYEPVYSEGWLQSIKIPQTAHKGQTPASKLSQAVQVAKLKSTLSNAVPPGTPMDKITGICNHKCLDKMACGHKCCKSSSNKRTPSTTAETPGAAKLARKETNVLRENRDIKEMFDIVEQHSSVKNKPRISMTKDHNLKTLTPGKTTTPITLQHMPRISVPHCREQDVSNRVHVYPRQSNDTSRFLFAPLDPNKSRLYNNIDPRHQTQQQQLPRPCNLNNSVNGWTDFNTRHRSTQNLFANDQPEHLYQQKLIYGNELESFSCSPELVVNDDVVPTDKVGDCVWSTTTSSDEELCQFVDASIMTATGDDERWQKTLCEKSISNEKKKMSINHERKFDDVLEEELESDILYHEELYREMNTESEQLNTYRSYGNYDLLKNRSPAVISINDSDSVISVSSTENQFGILNHLHSRSPAMNGRKLSQSVTPTFKSQINSSLMATCNTSCDSGTVRSGTNNNSCFTDITSQNNVGKTSSQLCHRYGLVQAWKKDTTDSVKPQTTSVATHDSMTRPGQGGMSLFFVPKERLASQDSQTTSNLFEGIFL